MDYFIGVGQHINQMSFFRGTLFIVSMMITIGGLIAHLIGDSTVDKATEQFRILKLLLWFLIAIALYR